MSDLRNNGVESEKALDAMLEDLSPVRSINPGALERAFHRLTVQMEAPRAARSARTGVSLRRRTTAGLAVAAAAAGLLIAATATGRPNHARNGSTASGAALMQLAGYFRDQPAPAAGQFVKTSMTDDQVDNRPITECQVVGRIQGGQAQSSPPAQVPTVCRTLSSATRHQHVVDVRYRPADLGNPTTPWVRQVAADGQQNIASSAKCDGFDAADTDPCGAGSWSNMTPPFLAKLAEQGPGVLVDRFLSGSDPSTTALWDVLAFSAGDRTLQANVFEAMAVSADRYGTFSAEKTATGYEVTSASRSSDQPSVTMRLDLATGTVVVDSVWSDHSEKITIASQSVDAAQVPSAEPYVPPTDNPSGGALAPSSAPSK